jgi:thiol-disulfide isomerase/thioredoxin
VDRARQSGAYVFAEFTSESCPMCQEMVPVIESVLAEHPQVQRVVHDADLEVDLAKKYGVRCVPVYVIVAPSGEIRFNDVGMRSAEELRTILRDAGVTNP